MKKVAVEILLATYNGEKYLTDQINSILEQTNQDFRILIRDDGSTDGTKAIIQSYTKQHPEKIIQIAGNKHISGVINNFSKLIEVSTAPYVMFSDQDDIWLPDKIQRSLKTIQLIEQNHTRHTPVLVHSDLCVVDETLREIAPSFLNFSGLNPERDNFHQLLIQNVVTGSSSIMNRALADKSTPIPSEALMHDWWIALIASGLGKIDFIDHPTILYRQHKDNILGAKNFNFEYVYRKAKGVFSLKGESILANNFYQAKAFRDRFALQMPQNNLTALNKFIELEKQNFLIRRYMLIKHGFFKGKFAQNVGLFLKI